MRGHGCVVGTVEARTCVWIGGGSNTLYLVRIIVREEGRVGTRGGGDDGKPSL